MLESSCGGVAGIGKGEESLLVALRINPGKGLLRQIDLPPHLQQLGNRLPLERCRDAGNRPDIAGHLVSGGAVTPGCGADQAASFVKQADRHTIHLGLDREGNLLPRQKPLKPLHEIGDLLGRVGIVQTLHRDQMPHLLESALRPPPDPLGG